MTTQMTIKESLAADFAAYMQTVKDHKLVVKVAGMQSFKQSWAWGSEDLCVTPTVEDGRVMVEMTLSYWGSASGYHEVGKWKKTTLSETLKKLDEMKEQLGETIYDPRMSGYQMGQSLDQIKEALLSI